MGTWDREDPCRKPSGKMKGKAGNIGKHRECREHMECWYMEMAGAHAGNHAEICRGYRYNGCGAKRSPTQGIEPMHVENVGTWEWLG